MNCRRNRISFVYFGFLVWLNLKGFGWLITTKTTSTRKAVPTAHAEAAQGLKENAANALLRPGEAGCLSTDTLSKDTIVESGGTCPAQAHTAGQVCPFEQVRLTPGLWDEASGQWWMSVSFVSLQESIPPPAKPIVRLSNKKETIEGKGTEEGCVLVFTGTSTSYEYFSSGGPYFNPATMFYSSPLIHHTDVGPLQPSTTFYYQVGRSEGSESPPLLRETIFQFRTPPAPGIAPAAAGDSMTIVMIGDIGQTTNSNDTACTVKDRWKADASVAAAVIIGDMAYADGDGNRWDTWGRLMEPTFSHLPLLVLPGNHEIEYDAKTGMPFTAYRHRFRMPSNLPENIGPVTGPQDFLYEGGSSYYSVNVGLVHFVMINNYNTHSGLVDLATDPQRLFVEADLEAVDRSKTPFVIVCMHNPLYNSNLGHHGEETTHITRSWAEVLFIKYAVDAVFAGHVHAYERNGGVAYGTPSPNAPVYITVGNGGNHEGLYNEWLPKPPYSIFRDGRYYGHGEITVYNRTHIKWTWIPNPEQGDNLPSDETWLRPRPEPTDTLALNKTQLSSESVSDQPFVSNEMQGYQMEAYAVPLGGASLVAFVIASLACRSSSSRWTYAQESMRAPLLPAPSNQV